MDAYSNYPPISVVIPSFNQGQYIEETLISVIGQQYPNLEIIVVDGGSTDNTVSILEKYSNKLSYWHSKKDEGQADAINQGIRLSHGSIVCWLNSDDLYLPGTLIDIGERFRGKINQAHLIYGSAIGIHENNLYPSANNETTASFNSSTLTYFDYIVQPSAFWTRKLWENTGELNTCYKYVLDWDWFIRASKLIDFEYVPKFYSLYRHHKDHKTINGGQSRQKEIIEVVQKYNSEYWINLYHKVQKHHSKIQAVSSFLSKQNVPRKNSFLPLLFPQILKDTKSKQDFLMVMYMYGIS
jgi:glycosyltransferase involved in cell wall biosynthesis